VWEVKNTSEARDFKIGNTVAGQDVGVRLTPLTFKFVRGVIIRAPGSQDLVPNTDIVFVSTNPNVTAGTNLDLDGIPVLPGGAIELPIEEPDKVYVVSQSAGQKVCWFGA